MNRPFGHVYAAATPAGSARGDALKMDEYRLGFEEDERRRSDFIRELTLQQMGRAGDTSLISESAVDGAMIPRTLVRFWHDSLDVPSDVIACLKSWDALQDEGFSIRMFDDASAATYIAEWYGPRERAA